jgi:hypothetical protein
MRTILCCIALLLVAKVSSALKHSVRGGGSWSERDERGLAWTVQLKKTCKFLTNELLKTSGWFSSRRNKNGPNIETSAYGLERKVPCWLKSWSDSDGVELQDSHSGLLLQSVFGVDETERLQLQTVRTACEEIGQLQKQLKHLKASLAKGMKGWWMRRWAPSVDDNPLQAGEEGWGQDDDSVANHVYIMASKSPDHCLADLKRDRKHMYKGVTKKLGPIPKVFR